MNISEPTTSYSQDKPSSSPVWQLPFRSFFLAGGAFASISIALWLMMLTGILSLSQQVILSVVWHAHEMIFGFAALIAVGFILTAVQTWTGKASITGLPVLLLIGIWAVIRALLYINNSITVPMAIVLQSIWWLAVISIYARIVFSAQNRRNYLFIPLLAVLATLNLVTLVASWLGHHDIALHVARSAVLLFTIIMAVVGGRVIPFFTARGVSIEQAKPVAWLEKCLLPISVLGLSVFIIGFFVELPITPAVFMITAGTLHMVRLLPWLSTKVRKVPLLWSLHLSYLLMSLGLIALGLSYFVPVVTFSSALHLITLGAIGLMIIAMMSRVSLGHTGRMLSVKPQITAAFILIVLAAISRFALPLLGYVKLGWLASASLWVIGFSLFFFIYWPVLTSAKRV